MESNYTKKYNDVKRNYKNLMIQRLEINSRNRSNKIS